MATFTAAISGVKFLHRLRDEAKYDGLDALRAAIARDAEQARDYFRKHG